MDKVEMIRRLGLLNQELAARNITGEICIVGGAAMVLAFGSRQSTEDIDALMKPSSEIRTIAAQIAQEHSFPSGWINDGVKGFFSQRKEMETIEILTLSHLRVVYPQPEYILAMKCIAARVGVDRYDSQDVKFLISHLGLKNAEEVLKVVSEFYEPARIPAKTQFFVAEICDELFQKN